MSNSKSYEEREPLRKFHVEYMVGTMRTEEDIMVSGKDMVIPILKQKFVNSKITEVFIDGEKQEV